MAEPSSGLVRPPALPQASNPFGRLAAFGKATGRFSVKRMSDQIVC